MDTLIAGTKMVFMELPIADLKIDRSYQRQEPTSRRILEIKKKFMEEAMPALTVGRRTDGAFYVPDGQARMLAMRAMGYLTATCRVFESRGPEHEARVFKILNEGMERVRANERFQSAVVAGDEPERSINDWLRTIGLTVSHHSAPEGLTFPHHLVATWKKDKEAVKQAIIIGKRIVGPDNLDAAIFKGLFYLSHNGIAIDAHVEKMVISGGRTGLLRAIKTASLDAMQNTTEKICGRGILAIINKGKRNKIKISQGEDE